MCFDLNDFHKGSFMNRRLIICLIVFGMIITGCKFLKKKKDAAKKADTNYKISVPVTVSPAVQGDLTEYLTANGVTYARRSLDVNAQISGEIKEINFDEYDRCAENDTIIELKSDNLELDLRGAQIQEQKARAEYDAWKTVSQNSSNENLKLQTGLSEAMLYREKLENNLKHAIVKAPFSGTVSEIFVEAGEEISAGQKLYSLYDMEIMRVEVNILESEVNEIKKGAYCKIKFPAVTGEVFEGKVKSISPDVNEVTRVCRVIIELKNNGRIKHGMYADVKIARKINKNVVFVHRDAVLSRDGKTLVFAAQDGLAKWQYVKPGVKTEYFTEILDGVEAGQEIIVEGNFSLSHDANISVADTISFAEISRQF